MIVWVSTIPMFWYVTLYNFREGHLSAGRQWQGAINFAQRHHLDILIVWLLIIVLLILKRFWYYWSTVI
jgi:hypothetical protein